MTNFEEIRTKYMQDVATKTSKQRFGFFSLPPSSRAGNTEYFSKKASKDENGRVKTKQRNIYSGITSSGTLKKSFFQYQPSIFHGDQYMDPGKVQRLQVVKENKQNQGKQIFKPNNFTSMTVRSAYPYLPESPKKKKVQDIVDQDGKVKTQQRNIFSSPQSKIQHEKIKKVKHMTDPYENHLLEKKKELQKNISLRGQTEFKRGAPMKQCFSTIRQTFGEQGLPEHKKKRWFENLQFLDHETNFKPSCRKKYDIFSYPKHVCEGEISKKQSGNQTQRSGEVFKPVKYPNFHKPSPSITGLKVNLMRSYR